MGQVTARRAQLLGHSAAAWKFRRTHRISQNGTFLLWAFRKFLLTPMPRPYLPFFCSLYIHTFVLYPLVTNNSLELLLLLCFFLLCFWSSLVPLTFSFSKFLWRLESSSSIIFRNYTWALFFFVFGYYIEFACIDLFLLNLWIQRFVKWDWLKNWFFFFWGCREVRML